MGRAKQMYPADERALVGLPQDGIKAATYKNLETMLRLALALTVAYAEVGGMRPAIDVAKRLRDVTRDDLVAFKRRGSPGSRPATCRRARRRITVRPSSSSSPGAKLEACAGGAGAGEEAAHGFRRTPTRSLRWPRYNLADGLRDLGRPHEALPHWRA